MIIRYGCFWRERRRRQNASQKILSANLNRMNHHFGKPNQNEKPATAAGLLSVKALTSIVNQSAASKG